jgi:hypothetical protein
VFITVVGAVAIHLAQVLVVLAEMVVAVTAEMEAHFQRLAQQIVVAVVAVVMTVKAQVQVVLEVQESLLCERLTHSQTQAH